jgi:hypothetical protein
MKIAAILALALLILRPASADDGSALNNASAQAGAASDAVLRQGHAPEGADFDLQGFIVNALKSGARHVVVPPGRYRVSPRNREHLVLRGLRDVEIIADGVEMVCTETTRALTISRCTNVVLRGLVIDYDPLPFTQGRITAISADRQKYAVELFDGYPAAAMVRNFKYEVFCPDTRTLRCEDRDVRRIDPVDPAICAWRAQAHTTATPNRWAT